VDHDACGGSKVSVSLRLLVHPRENPLLDFAGRAADELRVFQPVRAARGAVIRGHSSPSRQVRAFDVRRHVLRRSGTHWLRQSRGFRRQLAPQLLLIATWPRTSVVHLTSQVTDGHDTTLPCGGLPGKALQVHRPRWYRLSRRAENHRWLPRERLGEIQQALRLVAEHWSQNDLPPKA